MGRATVLDLRLIWSLPVWWPNQKNLASSAEGCGEGGVQDSGAIPNCTCIFSARPNNERRRRRSCSFWRWLEKRYAGAVRAAMPVSRQSGHGGYDRGVSDTQYAWHAGATACVADGKSAVRRIRANAGKLGVDPDRITASRGGGSAGGHVAACTGVIDGFESKGEDDKISSAPNAMVLFNPPCVPGRPFPGGMIF